MGKERVAVVGIGQTKHQATRGDVSMAGLVREAHGERGRTGDGGEQADAPQCWMEGVHGCWLHGSIG